MPRTRPLRALLPTLLAFLPLALATASGHVRDSLLRSKHWLVDGPALRTAYVAAAWAGVACVAYGAAFQASKFTWG
jgi:hypothetical protein